MAHQIRWFPAATVVILPAVVVALPIAPLFEEPSIARRFYLEHGFCALAPFVPARLVENALRHAQAVVNGDYESGIEPVARWTVPGDLTGALVKVDQPHYADRALLEIMTLPSVGRWAAAVGGSRFVQIWAVQLLYKPPGGASGSTVGWHQDDSYWTDWMRGETFTMWLALTDVTPVSGPLRSVVGSHRWGPLEGGDFFSDDITPKRGGAIAVPAGAEWREMTVAVPAGGASLHSPLTLHGSGPNLSDAPRVGLALHLRTERTTVMPGAPDDYPTVLEDPERCPVIYDARDVRTPARGSRGRTWAGLRSAARRGRGS